MTENEKQLLIKDLCTRLSYGVKCSFMSSKGDIPSTIVKVDIENETVSHKPEGQSLIYFHFVESGNIKPYLRSMSSMTEKEKEEMAKMSTLINSIILVKELGDWLNSHYFDYRGLIPMGLALEAPEGMYKND